jgi:hypothetical protein
MLLIRPVLKLAALPRAGLGHLTRLMAVSQVLGPVIWSKTFE